MLNKSISELSTYRLALVLLLALSGCGRRHYDAQDTGSTFDDVGRVDLDADAPAMDSGLVAPSDALFTFRDAPFANCGPVTGALGSGACPSVCSGGCDAGVCTIDCTGVATCIEVLVCPPGWPCSVFCGFRACTSATFDGTNASSLSVECTGDESCVSADMVCPTAGDCGVFCVGLTSCVSFSQACGGAQCAANCTGASATAFDQQCNGSRCCSIVNCR